jgi:hypothetical protein
MSFTPLHADEKDFEDAVEAIAPDMPLLMHGCGDVAPSDVNPETARLVAQLTVKHISELVDAAVDAHHILTDGAGGLLPPPPLANKRKEVSSSSCSTNTPKRQKASATDYWDEPLPEPKIRSENSTEEKHVVNADEWCGVAGVDFFQDSRSRSAFVSAPLTAIGVQSFVFPVCHDSGLYGRVMEVQAARRNIAPVLMDSTWLDMVNAEGGRLLSSKNKRPETPANDTENPEDTEQEDGEHVEEEVLPTWPGLDSLLPIHREG